MTKKNINSTAQAPGPRLVFRCLSRLPWVLAGALGATPLFFALGLRPAVPVAEVRRGDLGATAGPSGPHHPTLQLAAAGAASVEPQGRVSEFLRIGTTAKDPWQTLLGGAAWCEHATSDEILRAFAHLTATEVGKEQRMALEGLLMTRLSLLDPELAANIAIELQAVTRPEAFTLKRIAFERWVAVAPADALARALESGPAESSEKATLIFNMLSHLAKGGALDLADALVADMQRRGDANLAGYMLGMQKSRCAEIWREGETPEKLVRWIDEQGGSPASRAALGEHVLQLALERETESATLVQLAMRFQEVQNSEALLKIAAKVGVLQPDLAIALFGRNMGSHGLIDGWAGLLETQARANQPVSFARLPGLAEFPARDQVLGRLSAGLRSEAPEIALRAASEIANPSQRTHALMHLAFDWMPRATDQARRALPPDIVGAFDRLVELQRSGVLDVIPGFVVDLSYRPKLGP